VKNRAKSVEAETANTEVSHLCNDDGHRNAYQVNPDSLEYNPGKSARDPVKGQNVR
jgi:hypothetical protein